MLITIKRQHRRVTISRLTFGILRRLNPILAIIGTFSLALASKHQQVHLTIGWLIMMFYNLSNIYVYYCKRHVFGWYMLSSLTHFTIGLWAVL